MSRRLMHALAAVVTCGVGGASASAAVTPGALLDFDAFDNAGAASNEWTNNGTLGGKLLPGGAPAPTQVVNDGGVTYYTSAGPSWGDDPSSATNPQITGIDSFTAEVWLRRLGTGTGAEHHILGFNTPSFSQYAQLIFREGAGHDDDAVVDVFLKGETNTRVKSFDIGGSAAAIADNVFTQIAVSFNDTTDTINVYRDGSLVGSATSEQDFDPSIVMNQMAIFKTYAPESNSRRLNGEVSRVRLYNTELSASQIADNFAFGNTVPEPAAAGIVAAGALVALGRRRRRSI
jgi:hypothetical protein